MFMIFVASLSSPQGHFNLLLNIVILFFFLFVLPNFMHAVAFAGITQACAESFIRRGGALPLPPFLVEFERKAFAMGAKMKMKG